MMAVGDMNVWTPLRESTANRYCDAISRLVNWHKHNVLRDSTRPFETDDSITDYAIDNIKDEELYNYLDECLRNGFRSNYIRTELNAMKWIHKHLANIPRCWFKSEQLLKDYATTHESEEPKGISWDQVEDICNVASIEKSMSSYRDIALIRVMSDCLLRVSEVIQIDTNHIKGYSIKFGYSRLQIGPKTKKALDQYKKVAKITSGPLFRPNGKGFELRNERMSDTSARAAIKHRITSAGIKTPYVGNSFRAGSIESFLRAGASLEAVQELSRHKTKNSLLQYINKESNTENILEYRYGDQYTHQQSKEKEQNDAKA